MIFESTAKAGLKDIDKNNLLKNETILEILENVAGEHSNAVNFGVLDMDKTHCSWVILEWKVEVIKRPIYSEKLKIQTWGRYFQKAYTYRDFKVFNEKGELCIIATSKWALIDINTHSIMRLTDDIKNLYKPEDQISVFGEDTISKINIPENFSNSIDYKIGRKDIDINNHLHNTYYLNLAYESLPEEVYNNRPYNKFKITYKKEIGLGDIVTCKYANINGKHIIVLETKEKHIVNSIIELNKK